MRGGGTEMSKIDTSSWKKFKISELFMAQTGNVDIQKVHINGKGVSVVSSGVEGNGIIGKTDMNAKVFPAGTLTVDMFGNTFYRDFEYKMVTHARVFSLSLKDDTVAMLPEVGLFLEASLKFLTQMYSFNNMCTFDKISDLEISLPVTTKDVPDWDYMQERIAELEQERIAELEQYLVAAGLNDYTLTEDDLKVLSLSGSGRDEDGNPAAHAAVSKRTEQFVISNVFELHKGQRLTKADQIPGRTPFIGSTACDNGVTGYIGQAPIFEGNAITVSYNGSVGQVFYQEKPFWASDDINVLYLKDHLLDRELFGYLGASLYKAGTGFSYTFKWNIERMRDTMFVLPIQTDEFGTPVIDEAKVYHPDGYVPDWEYMAAYIRAMEKLVIRDVVDYKDEFIRQHRLAVAGSGV